MFHCPVPRRTPSSFPSSHSLPRPGDGLANRPPLLDLHLNNTPRCRAVTLSAYDDIVCILPTSPSSPCHVAAFIVFCAGHFAAGCSARSSSRTLHASQLQHHQPSRMYCVGT
jgi:hypothetical protein